MSLRSLARRLLGVRRVPTYFLPWIARPGLECALLLNNVERRFTERQIAAPLRTRVTQYDGAGTVVRAWDVTLADNADVAEVPLAPAGAGNGHGFVVVDTRQLHSDLYVTLSDGETYTATHGRAEFIEEYPRRTRWLVALLGAVLAAAGRTIPAFVRHQYVYAGPDSRSHVLLLNLSDVANRVRVEAADGRARLVRLPPRGSHLLDAGGLVPPGRRVAHLRLTGNAWFNLYLVGAGQSDLAGPLSLMHVK